MSSYPVILIPSFLLLIFIPVLELLIIVILVSWKLVISKIYFRKIGTIIYIGHTAMFLFSPLTEKKTIKVNQLFHL